MPTEKQLLLPHEMARLLRVSPSWVRSHAAPSCKTRIPAKKVGRLIRFDPDEVFAWLETQQGEEKARR
jgi:excisionase family DNA binding protein